MKESDIKRNSWQAWWLASRPKTLTGAAVPVMIGAALALADSHWHVRVWPMVLCFLFAFIMQIDANFVNDYFDFNEKSASFTAYYEYIDAKNVPILEKIQNDFLAELEENGIEVKSSSDKILKESIKKSHYILPKNGYWDKGFFDLYEAKNSDDFFYIEKNHKNRFKKIVNTYYKRLEKEIIPYFEPRRK